MGAEVVLQDGLAALSRVDPLDGLVELHLIARRREVRGAGCHPDQIGNAEPGRLRR